MSEEKQEKKEIQFVRLTDVRFVGVLAPRILEFKKKHLKKCETITYEDLYSYFTETVQFFSNGGVREFWVAFEDGVPVGFAHWLQRALPHRGLAYMDFVYVWSKNPDVLYGFFEELHQYAVKFNCPFVEGDATTETTFRLFKRRAKEVGYEVEKTGIINFKASKTKSEE